MHNNLTFKTDDKIVIHHLEGVELKIQPEDFGWLNHEPTTYHRLFGQFFYCGLVLEGQLIVAEKDFNEIIEPLELTIDTIDCSTIYFRPHSKEQLHNMRLLLLKTRCIGDEEAESEFDENFIFHLIG